jgi:erythronate-4-phosphate dehydrogenase
VIGKRLHQRLGSLGISCVAFDPWLDQAADPSLVSLEEVLACDVISIHAELTEREPYPSVHLLNRDTLARIPASSLLINAARGAVVDNRALLARLQGVSSPTAVLDVWEGEPEVDTRLLDLCRYGTPHIAGYSYDGKLLATHMLFEAACAALSLEATEGSGAGADAIGIEVPASLTGADLVRWLQAQSYDIRSDDKRMRAELEQGFDRLRRLYPVRRELGAFRVDNFAALSDAAQKTCAAMGCRVPR